MPRIAIIGGGVAAHTLVTSLLAARTEDADLTIDIFSAEAHLPYRRPEVNKGILIEGKSPAEVALPGGIFYTPGVTLHLSTTVTGMDLAARTLSTGDATHHFDQLVFATGAGPRQLETDWSGGRDVHYIRTPEHAAALREKLSALGTDGTVVVIGGGVLGMEAAAAAATLSEAGVHVLELGDEVCARILPPTASRWLRDRHAEKNVTVTCGVSPDDLPGTVEALAPDVVIVSIGAVRDTHLAEDADLTVGDGDGGGIVVDEQGRTGVPGVFAVGDCVEIHSADGSVLRPEDDGSARALATLVASQLADRAVEAASFRDRPMKGWTKQFGHLLTTLGTTGVGAGLGEQVLLDTGEELVVFTVDGSTVVGVTTVGRSPEVRAAKKALGTVLAG
ncbi:FAD-dependent oxidoreductase [Corynebacterium terpenotabidum]|uniref:Ferredoxin-NAD+ reductase n=1 Tax=Corynebacterium terpenotabidum Y-11 TaxID=1200352 RepID=S4XMP7_9CORY|nr:FAD-dependent oxidoreductase [Corynebacterium terpenotabidum]AGP31938.1 ferredoxin-NAD+ reductase [Corynebacterium terpenotabidum Y-11]